jgi:hypothetical protein
MMKSKVPIALIDKGTTIHGTQVEDMCICSKSLDGESKKKEYREIKETEQTGKEGFFLVYLDHLASDFMSFFLATHIVRLISTATMSVAGDIRG